MHVSRRVASGGCRHAARGPGGGSGMGMGSRRGYGGGLQGRGGPSGKRSRSWQVFNNGVGNRGRTCLSINIPGPLCVVPTIHDRLVPSRNRSLPCGLQGLHLPAQQ